MNKKIIIMVVPVLVLILIAGYFLATKKESNPSTKTTYRIGIISGLDFFLGNETGFMQKMTQLGYRESKDISYDFQKVNSDPETAKKIIQKFVDDGDDLIFAFPTNVALQAKQMTQDTRIPVVFDNASIEGTDLIQSINNPGGNITGVRQDAPALAVERYLVMRQLVPAAKKMAIFYLKTLAIVPPQLERLRALAKAAKIQIVEIPALNKTDVENYLQAQDKLTKPDFDSILMVVEPLTTMPDIFQLLAQFADQHKMPIGGATVSSGGYESLYGVAVDNIVSGQQAAPLADEILKGTQAGSIPVVTAQTFLTINLRAAKKMGIKVGDDVLSQADQVIK